MKKLLLFCLMLPTFAHAAVEEVRGSRAALTKFMEAVIVDECIHLWQTGDVDKIMARVDATAKEISSGKIRGVSIERLNVLEAEMSQDAELLERLLTPHWTTEKWDQNLYWKIPGSLFGLKEGEEILKLSPKLQIKSVKLAGNSRADLLQKIEVSNAGTGFVLILEKRASTSELCNLEQTMIVDIVITTNAKKKYEFQLTQTGGGWSDERYQLSETELRNLEKAMSVREINPNFNPREPSIYAH